MATYWPSANGLWSTLSNWLTATATQAGTLPTIADDVYADGKNIYIDISTSVASVRTTARSGGVAGGNFYPNNNITLSATNIVPGTTTCITFLSAFPNTCTIVGNVSGSNTTGIVGINNNTSGTMTIYGSVEGGPIGGNAYGAYNASTGTLTIYGNVSGARAVTATGYGVFNNSIGIINIIGNSYGRVAAGLINNSTGVINITGNCIGSSTNNIYGSINNSFGILNIFGICNGGSGTTTYGVNNNSGGTVQIYGNSLGGTGATAYGANNNATGFMYVQGTAIGNGWGLGSSGIGGAAPGIFGSQTGTTIIQGLSCGARGQWPTAGNVFILPTNTSTTTMFTSASAAQVLFTSLSTNIVPPASSVRLGTKYNLNDYTGTCAIPSISSVLQGVAVDNSIGIVALQPQTVWSVQTSAIDTNSLGGRLKESATVQSFGQLLTAFNM